jgi:phage/plasmid primase-like uncharacterized protein
VEPQKHDSILDFTKQQIAEALAVEIDAKGRAFTLRPERDYQVREGSKLCRGEIYQGKVYVLWAGDGGGRNTYLVIGFDHKEMFAIERHYGFTIRFIEYGDEWQKPNYHTALRHILGILKDRLGLEIPPPEEKLEAPDLTTEEWMAKHAAQKESEEKARAEKAEADAEALKAKRQQQCNDAGIDIDLNAKIEGLDEDAILDNEEACLAAIHKELGFAPNEIIRDGKTHYFGNYENGAGGAGWYCYHDDPQRPWASFGNRRKGDNNKFIWKGAEGELTPEQLQAWEKRHVADLLIDEIEREEGLAKAAEKAREEWNRLPDADDNCYYLQKKKVGAYGIKWCNRRPIGDIHALQTLVVPVRNIKGEIISLNFICGGDKSFYPKTTVKGGFHLIGPEIKDKLAIAEGYATSASIQEMTGLTVAVAFDAANMVEVAQVFRAKYPGVEIILAGDDDLFTEQTQGHNPGRNKAEEAAESVGGVALLPPFDASERKSEKKDPTDWNDLAGLHGKDAAGACFMSMLKDWHEQQKALEEGPDAPASRYSEAALANLLDAKYGHRIRYVDGWGKWFVYNGKVWKEDQTSRVFSYARKICAEVATPLNGGNKTEQGMGRKINSAQCISAVMKIARSLPRIAATMEQWDADPWLLNTPKGVVDLRTGQMRPHRPEDYMTKSTKVSPGGACPRFLKFLGEVTDNNKEMIDYLQRKDAGARAGTLAPFAWFSSAFSRFIVGFPSANSI